jgi:nucleotide-binding universal stress UspA family protein
MLGSVLIGLDTSKHGTTAGELAIHWARQQDACLVGLAIVDEPGIRALEPAFPVGGTPGVDPVLYMGYQARIAQVKHNVGRLLDQFAARCALAGVKHQEMKAIGSPYEIIAREAHCCDLVMMDRAAQFRFTARGDEHDETLRKVLSRTARPVVVAPAPAPPPAPVSPDGPVVIAYDASLQSARALAAVQAAGLVKSGQVHIVCVNPSKAEGTDYLERARRFLIHHKIEAVTHLVETSGPPADVLLEQVGRLGAGMLVMGAYGQPTLREFILGSVTRTALSECPVPLFLSH